MSEPIPPGGRTARSIARKLAPVGGGSWLALALLVGHAHAHELVRVTHSFGPGVAEPGPRLELLVTDAESGQPIAARVSLTVNGASHVPGWVDGNAIRFTSTHLSKRQNFTAVYVRGTGAAAMGLPPDARRVEVRAACGFEYRPAQGRVEVTDGRATATLALRRWSNLAVEGWISADEHLHYDRIEPGDDRLWLDMLAGDGLNAGHFMVLKGGLVPGVWSTQHTYGRAGQVGDGQRLIVPGQEYRDSEQGHINLLGLDEVIEPMSTGGMGMPRVMENFPVFHDVLARARAGDGLVGVAHGGIFGRHATAVADAVLGALDFWELSNGFVYSTDTWYRLMNCGIFITPAAGTDLPNLPFREPWQPMFGAVRTYVHTDGRTDFAAFKQGMANGRVFITGGPLVDIEVEGTKAGGTVTLPAGGGFVTVRGQLHSPQLPRELTLVHNGRDEAVALRRNVSEAVYRWSFESRIHVERSGWFAVEGKGPVVPVQGIDAMAHTGAVRVIVGGLPVRSAPDREHLSRELEANREHYRRHGVYRQEADRQRAVSLFDEAIENLLAP
jgi:hypothetical protein